MKTKWGVGLEAFLACGLSQASLAEKISLRPNFVPGQAWKFSLVQNTKSDNTMTMQGQSQQFQSAASSRRAGGVEVVEVQSGLPTKIRVAFAANCENEMSMANQPPQKMRFPYSGQIVTLTKDASGRVSDDFRGEVDPGSRAELHAIIDMNAPMFPGKPVEIGEEWQANPQTVARMLGLEGPNNMAGLTCKLLSVKTVANRPTAEVKISIGMQASQGNMSMEMVTQGVSLIDLETGQTIQTDARGTVKTTGQEQGPGPDGQPVTYNIAGQGTVDITGKAAMEGNVVRPDGNKPDSSDPRPAPAGDLAGTYMGNNIKLDLQPAGPGAYKGTLTFNGRDYPVTAQSGDGKSLTGKFTAGNDAFDFIAGPNAQGVMVLTSGGKTYELPEVMTSAPVNNNPLGN